MSKSSNEKRGMWTIAIVFGVLFLLFFVFVVLLFGSIAKDGQGENPIGVIDIKGPIVSADKIVKDLEAFVQDEDIRGILIRIDSPGGTVGASQEIHEAVARAHDKKKVVISLGNVAASGGYYIAVAGPRIFANAGTLTGSIGVIMQTYEVDALLDQWDLRVHTYQAGANKDIGNPFRDASETDRRVLEGVLKDIHQQFIQAVATGRKLEAKDVEENWADGRVFTGKTAQEGGLVDELGGFQAAIDHLGGELGFEGPPTLIYPKRDAAGLLSTLLTEGVETARTELRARDTPSIELRYTGGGW